MHVFGIGSPAGDDQAGWLVVDALRASADRGARRFVLAKLDRPGAALIAWLQEADQVIVIDAMQGGGTAGSIRHFDRTDWPAYAGGLSSHGFGVLAALALARELGALPPRLDLYGIEVGSVDPGDEPGEAIRAAAQALARQIADGFRESPRA